MKVRVLSALVGLVILFFVLLFIDTPVLNIVIGIIGALAVTELLSATKTTKHPALYVLAVITSVIIPFAGNPLVLAVLPQVVFIIILAMFVILLKDHRSLNVSQGTMVLFFAFIIPLFFSSAIYIRDIFGGKVGGMYILWALGSGWLSDSGAYFFGRAFGKHKLAPVISPKKTIEGAAGGIVTASLGMILVGFIYQLIVPGIHVNYLLMVLITPLFSAIGILGDLAASLIKRQFGVKDYGNIMPGHGGVLDRFDSTLFTIPAVFITVQHIVVASLI